MKTLSKLALLVSLLAALASAQTQLTITTLSSAVSTTSTNFVTLTATTGLTAQNSYIYVDQEAMLVTSIPASGTTIGVARGQSETSGATHANGAPVVLIPTAAVAYTLVDRSPTGSCARGSSNTATPTLYLPIINSRTGDYTDCLGGYFVSGNPNPLQAVPLLLQNASPGDTVYTSVDTNGVALAATTDAYCAAINIPSARWLTGAKTLNGTSVATDSRILSLYDGGTTGYLLANTGTKTAGNYGSASEYGGAAFTQLYPAVQGLYFVCAQPVTAAGTASVRMMLTQQNDWVTGGIVTVTAASANATITTPTGFTTAQVPYLGLY